MIGAKWKIKVAVIIMVLTVFSGCGLTGKRDEGVTLNVVTMFGGDDHNGITFRKINENFMELYDDIKINDRSSVSDEAWKESVIASFQNGDEPDVLFFFADAVAEELVQQNQFMNIGEIQAKYPDYALNIREDALRGVMAGDGEIYAVPLTGYYEGLFCNESLFEEYGLQLPTTWEYFIEAVKVFSENGIVPVAVSLDEIPHYWIEHLILSQGGIEEHKLNPTDGVVPQSWAKGLSYFKLLYEMGAFPEEEVVKNNDQAEALFKEKKAAMQLDGSWYVNGIPDKDHTTILPFPTVPGGKKDPSDIIAGFSSGFYITKKAWNDPKKREAAIDFVMMHTSSASIARYWWGAGNPATPCIAPVGMQKLQNDGANMAAKAKGFDAAIDSRLKPEAFRIIIDGVRDMSKGIITPEEVLGKAISINSD